MLGLGSEEAAWGRRTPALGLADEWGLARGTNRGREARLTLPSRQRAGQGERAEWRGAALNRPPGAGPARLRVLGLDVDPQISVQFFLYRHAAPSSERQPLLPS